MNKNAYDFFANIAQANTNEKEIKLNDKNDFSQYDANFILNYVDTDTEILDLGSGTGLVINKIYKKVKSIVAVEPFSGFTKFITKSSNINIINENIFDFTTTNKFNLITIFGTMHYFNQKEAVEIYKKYYDYLKPNGKIIIKNQFGVHEDVTVDGFSEELQKNYYAQYRYYKNEMQALETLNYTNIQVFDIYPAECNRWENTHFYAIVASK